MVFESNIIIKGARVNNLKNINVEIPLNKFIVITGLSGSGKSSLAFDTLYAEGRRRYIESLSVHIRQFFGKINKPEVDFISGLPPVIAINRKVKIHNPRSTVATSIDIYDYLCTLFARIGKIISPKSGNLVRKYQPSDLIDEILQYPNGTLIVLLAQIIPQTFCSMKEQLTILMHEGFSRVEINNEIYYIEKIIESDLLSNNIYLVIDRLIVNNNSQTISRLFDSVETAFFRGNDSCILRFCVDEKFFLKEFSRKFRADGIEFEDPTSLMFNFSNPASACSTCKGFGSILKISEKLIIPDTSLSLFNNAVACWKEDKMSKWKQDFIKKSAQYKFPIYCPYEKLTQKEKKLLWHGKESLCGIDDFFKNIEKKLYKIQYKIFYNHYREKITCPTCDGKRLKSQALYVKIKGKSIADLMAMSIKNIIFFFENLQLSNYDSQIAKQLLIEINLRLQFLNDVGLGYLTLDRFFSTLSSGEMQRVNLAILLSNSLVGSLYILDEPTVGLHSKDIALLIKVLRKLQTLGSTVLVVEHDEKFIRSADYILDMGTGSGIYGGKIIYQGKIDELNMISKSHTIRYLTKKEIIKVPAQRRKCINFIGIKNVRKNNLKGFDVLFPLNIITVVTGVSGSGKSSLVCDEFYENLKQYYDYNKKNINLYGDLCFINSVEFINQDVIERSTRSNPAIYIKIFDEIRKLFAKQPLAKQLHFTSSHFSFNLKGGRCEECKGYGIMTVKMKFMADVILECEYCHGKRFNQNILEVEYQSKNIHDILNMTVDEAIIFFKKQKNNSSIKKIICGLQSLYKLGLGYIKLGQNFATLSLGENQRVKLAYHLTEEKNQSTLFIFDEPTIGLHFYDIKKMILAFNELINQGHTIVIIEHNMNIIKIADHIIDLGPEGGDNGGYLIGIGTPEEIAKNKNSITGKFLREKF